jgi:hypothetical protein
MVQSGDDSASSTIGNFGKGETLKDVVEDHKDSCYSAKTIQELVMRLGVGKRCRGNVFVLHIIICFYD